MRKGENMFTLEDTYSQAIKISRDIVEDVRFGRKLYFNPLEICSIEICKYQDDDKNILTLLNRLQDKNPYMYSHPVNVAFLSLVIGRWLNLDNKKLINLVRTGLLLDIGKAKIKDSLLNKPELLSLEEMEKLKSHPVIGYKILASVKIFDSDVKFERV
jgi:HD-GYP domain-containing protein (c-di-GMP phosphodiesterase class II)